MHRHFGSVRPRRWVSLPTALALTTVLLAPLALPGTGAAHRARPSSGGPPFLTARDFLAAGQPVPGTHPTLPVCPPATPDPGLASAEAARQARSRVDLSAPAVCQVDRSFGVFQERPRPAAAAGRRVLSHSNAYHWAGPATRSLNYHGASSVIQAVNPNVNHGGATEFVNGRTFAGDASGGKIEIGWTERSNFMDKQYVYACGTLQCFYDTGPSRFPLLSGGWYWFRVYQCGSPGQALTCADIYYDDIWQNVWTNELLRCTNSNETGNCFGENRSEVYSEDSTPHPAFGGDGMDFAVGELLTDSGWLSWTTSFLTNDRRDAPYVIAYYTQYSDFVVCQTACS
jgi:hypothetical protein